MSDRLWNRNFLLLMGITFCSGMTAQLISTAITPYMTYDLALSTTITGLLSSIYTIVSSCGRLIAGNLVDRFGRRKFIFIGFGFFAVGCFFFGAVTTVALLILFRIMQGIGFAVSSSASSAATADAIPAKRLGSGLGYMSIVNALTQIIGPLACTALIGAFGYREPFTFSAVACVVACVIAVFTKELFQRQTDAPKQKSGSQRHNAIFERRAILPAILQFFISLSFSTYMVWGYNLAVYKGYGELVFFGGILTFIGMFFAVGAVGMILARLLVVRFTDRVNEYALCIPASFLGAVSCAMVRWCVSPLMFLLGGVLYGVSLGVIQPALNTRSLRGIAADRRGAAIATYMFGFDGGIGIGATAWGVIIGCTSYDFMMAAAGVLMLAVTAAFAAAWRYSQSVSDGSKAL